MDYDVAYGIFDVACAFGYFNVCQMPLPVSRTLASPKNKHSLYETYSMPAIETCENIKIKIKERVGLVGACEVNYFFSFFTTVRHSQSLALLSGRVVLGWLRLFRL